MQGVVPLSSGRTERGGTSLRVPVTILPHARQRLGGCIGSLSPRPQSDLPFCLYREICEKLRNPFWLGRLGLDPANVHPARAPHHEPCERQRAFQTGGRGLVGARLLFRPCTHAC